MTEEELSHRVAQLISLLGSEKYDERQKARDELVAIGAPAVAQLVAELKPKSDARMPLMIDTLGSIKNEQALLSLVELLKDSDPILIDAVARALVKFGKAAVPHLIEVLRTGNFVAAMTVSRSLADLEDERAADPLIDALSHNVLYVRSAAAIALGRLKSKKAVEPLIELMKEPEKGLKEVTSEVLNTLNKGHALNVRAAAIGALGEIGDERAVDDLADACLKLTDPTQHSNTLALHALVKIGAPSVPRLVNLVGTEFWSPGCINIIEASENAAEALVKIGESSVMPLIEGMEKCWANRAPTHIMVTAVKALGNLRDKRAVEHLLPLLDNRKVNYRSVIVEALGKIKDKRASDALIKAVDDPESQVREAAISALGELGDTRACEKLAEVIGSEDILYDHDLKFKAANALAKLGDDRGYLFIFSEFSKYSRVYRQQATKAFEDLGATGIIRLGKAVKQGELTYYLAEMLAQAVRKKLESTQPENGVVGKSTRPAVMEKAVLPIPLHAGPGPGKVKA